MKTQLNSSIEQYLLKMKMVEEDDCQLFQVLLAQSYMANMHVGFENTHGTMKPDWKTFLALYACLHACSYKKIKFQF